MLMLEQQVAVVTGGGGAIGGAICRALAGAGARVAVLDINLEIAGARASELTALGQEAVAYGVDVGNYEQVHAIMADIHKRFGRLDTLVNCAGGSAREKMTAFHKQSVDVIHSMLNVNLLGALHCIRAAAPYMVEARSGRIVNITSIVARGGRKNCVEYGAAKGGVIAATKSLAIELGPENITVNCVSPGIVLRTALEDEAGHARRHSYRTRIGQADDIARAVLFLCLPESDYITGQDLAVDGGRSLGLKGDA